MAELTVQQITKDGLDPSFDAAAAGGDDYINSPKTFFVIKNDDAVSHTATIAVQRPTFDLSAQRLGEITFTAIAVAVPAGEERWISAPTGPYTDSDGKVQVTYDDETSVTVAAITVP